MEQKKILIPGGKYSDQALVNAAHRLGMYVITSGTHRDAPAHKIADKYIYADYSDKEAMLKIAQDEHIDYMCTCANDFGMISTAYVCEKLGLPGHDSLNTTLIVHNKDKFKPLAKKLGLHSPISEIFDDKQKAKDYILSHDEMFIIKPTDNVASIGVSRVNKDSDLDSAIDLAFEKSKQKSIVVEPFIEGFFTPCTSLIINEKVVAFFAESSFFYPQGEIEGPEFPANLRNNGGMQPAPFMDEWQDEIIEDFEKIAHELHLKDGKFHAELLVDKNHKAHIFDVHRRMSGFSTPYAGWNVSTPLYWEDWIVRAECGMSLEDFPKGVKQMNYGHYRNIYAPKNGHLKKVEFDTYLTSHIDSYFDAKNYVLENIDVTDYRHQPLVEAMRFKFDTIKETTYIADPNEDHFYEHIKFIYED